MTDPDKHKIATSFPDRYDTSRLDLAISLTEYKIFEDGFFAESMDDKWHVFVLEDAIYFARSWTNYCIYKVFTIRQNSRIMLSDFYVNRDESQYKSKDIDYDTILLKKLLQMFLKRDDFYSDPKLESPLIKETIKAIDPNDDCKKSIGSSNVGSVRNLYNGLTTDEQKQYFEVIGWIELREIIAGRKEDEPLTSLHLQNRQTKSASTYYFDNNADKLLGEITIKNKLGSSYDFLRQAD